MSIQAIAPVGADIAPSTAISIPAPASNFLDAVSTQLQSVDAGLRAAETQLASLAAGQDVSVHDVMIVMEEARTNMMLLVEVRNRVVEAYQELTRMQL
ncbi:flagellar hook-basal body complex protein FliE [Lysobacter korlensis]|uniref:Flagellar hook-basal body complex protein FliE n=1 Tax=Lysobacter korlensis TaxID=553636 RepID=A0ABV6RQ01_9GAMM